MKLQRIVFVLVMVISMLSAGRIPKPENPRKVPPLPNPSTLSGALGFDAKGSRSGVSLVVGTLPRGRTTEGPDGEPLGKRTAASQSCPLERTPLLSFLPKRKKNGPTIWSSKEPSSGRCCRGPRPARWNSLAVTGQRAPALNRESAPKWGKPIPLFNGKDLTGWRMAGTGTTVWKVEDGSLVSPGNGPELINDSSFERFQVACRNQLWGKFQ